MTNNWRYIRLQYWHEQGKKTWQPWENNQCFSLSWWETPPGWIGKLSKTWLFSFWWAQKDNMSKTTIQHASDSIYNQWWQNTNCISYKEFIQEQAIIYTNQIKSNVRNCLGARYCSIDYWSLGGTILQYWLLVFGGHDTAVLIIGLWGARYCSIDYWLERYRYIVVRHVCRCGNIKEGGHDNALAPINTASKILLYYLMHIFTYSAVVTDTKSLLRLAFILTLWLNPHHLRSYDISNTKYYY